MIASAARGPYRLQCAIAPERPLPDAASVSIDDHAAAHDMTAYLIGSAIAVSALSRAIPDHGASHARFDGYRAALKQAGLPLAEEPLRAGVFLVPVGHGGRSDPCMSLKNRPTAVFASNDDMAAAVLAACQRFNLRVPSQLSVAGFDDSLVAQVVWPPLTTCRQPIKEMAAAAVSMRVHKPLEGGSLERRLDHELVLRQSHRAARRLTPQPRAVSCATSTEAAPISPGMRLHDQPGRKFAAYSLPSGPWPRSGRGRRSTRTGRHWPAVCRPPPEPRPAPPIVSATSPAIAPKIAQNRGEHPRA